MANTDWISTVKDQAEGGWIVNGTLNVPNDPGNRHARDVLAWIAEGNTPDPADPPAPPLSARERIAARLRADPTFRALAAGVMNDKGWTQTQLLDWLVVNEAEAF